MKRLRLLDFALLIALVLACFPGIAPAKDAPASEKAAAVHPLRIAILSYVNTTDEIGATKMMEDVLRNQLRSIDKSRASFLWPSDVEEALTAHEQLARMDQITDRWSRFGKLDSTAVTGLDSLLLVDAILLVKINEWENHRVPVVGMGQSHTTVGFAFALYDVRTKALLWSKAPREQRFGAQMDAASSNVNYDETGVIQRKADNQPPRYESVAGDLVRDAFKKFPRG